MDGNEHTCASTGEAWPPRSPDVSINKAPRQFESLRTRGPSTLERRVDEADTILTVRRRAAGLVQGRRQNRLESTPAVTSASLHGKRVVDVTLCVLLLVATLPILIAVATLVALTSPGPILYRQTRVGLDGAEFRILKFRSMYAGSEGRALQLIRLNQADGPLFKVRQDPRVTRLGRWLRKFSLDELPQLVNVLHGSMSLVGPRPALPSEVATYNASTRRRLHVKPGVTGLWQISGRSDLSWQQAIALDLYYVDHGSALLDLMILLCTLPAVPSGPGAY